jgi:hypothetical protein
MPELCENVSVWIYSLFYCTQLDLCCDSKRERGALGCLLMVDLGLSLITLVSCYFVRIPSDLPVLWCFHQFHPNFMFIMDESYLLWFWLWCVYFIIEVIIRVIMMLWCVCGGRKCDHLLLLSELHDYVELLSVKEGSIFPCYVAPKPWARFGRRWCRFSPSRHRCLLTDGDQGRPPKSHYFLALPLDSLINVSFIEIVWWIVII